MGKGFIRKETDIKSLLLYSLSLLPFALDEALFFDYVHVDDGFDYFDFSQAEAELVSAGLIAMNLILGWEKWAIPIIISVNIFNSLSFKHTLISLHKELIDCP